MTEPKHTLWIVETFRGFNQHVPDRVAAYFSEDAARAHAARCVNDLTLVRVVPVDVFDRPQKEAS